MVGCFFPSPLSPKHLQTFRAPFEEQGNWVTLHGNYMKSSTPNCDTEK